MTEQTRAALALKHGQQARARILRRPEVELRTGLSRSAIYALMARHQFPPAVPLTAKAVGWLESSIDRWIDERVGHSEQANGAAQ